LQAPPSSGAFGFGDLCDTCIVFELEDLYLAEKELEEVRAGRSRTFTLDQVERELGLAD
jgi:hypothetical protein